MSRKIDNQDAQGKSKSSVGPIPWMVRTIAKFGNLIFLVFMKTQNISFRRLNRLNRWNIALNLTLGVLECFVGKFSLKKNHIKIRMRLRSALRFGTKPFGQVT